MRPGRRRSPSSPGDHRRNRGDGVAVSAGRVLGLDPGQRRIGVALSDPLGIIAQPHTVIDRRRGEVMAELRKIVDEYEVATIVVGLPTGLGGGAGPAVTEARAFGTAVTEGLGVEVEYSDERFTTVQAEAALIEGGMRRDARKDRRDKVAAALMLQGYLDRRNRAPEPPAIAEQARDERDREGIEE